MKEDMAHPFSTRTEHTRGEIKILEDFIKQFNLHHASKTIKKIISKKMIDWLETIPNEKLRSDVKKKYPRIRRLYHIIVSRITS
jgi:hypothetical protein